MKAKPPVDGAFRCYQLAPATEPEPFAWIAARLKVRGLEALEEGFGEIEGGEGLWTMYGVWVIQT